MIRPHLRSFAVVSLLAARAAIAADITSSWTEFGRSVVFKESGSIQPGKVFTGVPSDQMPSAFRDVSSIGQPVVLDANGSIRAATAGNHIFVTGSLYTGQTAPTGTLQFLNSSGSNIASFTTNGDLYVGGTVQPSSACFAASYEPEKWNSTSTR